MAAEEKSKKYWSGIGRRKTATASVRIFENEKTVTINNKPVELSDEVLSLFEIVGKKGAFGLSAIVKGGGKTSQIEAVRLGLARAMEKFDADFRSTLKKAGFLRRDPRDKERKKPGLRGARRSPQWAKR